MTDDLLLTVSPHRSACWAAFRSRRGSQVEQLTWSDDGEFPALRRRAKGYTPEDMQRKMAVFSNCVVIFSRYRAGVIKAPILHFRALEKLGTGITTGVPIHGQHLQHRISAITSDELEPHVNKVARHLAKALNSEAPRTSWYVRGTGGLNGDASAESRLDGAA